MKKSYHTGLSKYVTCLYYKRNDGTYINRKSDAGSVGGYGTPAHNWTFDAQIKIKVSSEIADKLKRELFTGPRYATLGDSGLAKIKIGG